MQLTSVHAEERMNERESEHGGGNGGSGRVLTMGEPSSSSVRWR